MASAQGRRHHRLCRRWYLCVWGHIAADDDTRGPLYRRMGMFKFKHGSPTWTKRVCIYMAYRYINNV